MERKRWTLLAVSVAMFMLLLDITVVNVALPSIRAGARGELHGPAVGDAAAARGTEPAVRLRPAPAGRRPLMLLSGPDRPPPTVLRVRVPSEGERACRDPVP
jgi:hypothetical protein